MFANETYVLAKYRRGQRVLSVNCVCIDSETRHSTRTKRHREHASAVSKKNRKVVKFTKLSNNTQTR